MGFCKKKSEHSKTIWVKKQKNKEVNRTHNRINKITLFAFLLVGFFISNNPAFANISLPFDSTIEFGIGLTKTLGGVIVLIGLVLAFIFNNAGRDGMAFKTGVWAFGVGVIIANLDWIGDKLGITSGALFF